MTEAIVNTSPLMYLYAADVLDLLRLVLGHVVVPEAVAAELEVGRKSGYRLPEPGAYPWIRIESGVPVPPGLPKLGRGEVAVLALAVHTTKVGGRPVVVLDDRPARMAAQRLALRCVGTLGVVARAKELGHVAKVRPIINAMVAAGFRVSPVLVKHVLWRLGEG